MLDHNSLLFSPTREGVPSSDDNFYASDLIAAQDALEEEAREAIPFASTECTYDAGYIKQPLFACLTCLHHRAVCAGCSVSCHGEHQLVELFNRRNFRCDCGTEAMGAGSCCQLAGRQDAPANAQNEYDKNFRGEFCFCGKAYDPETESDTMLQCIACQDWIHWACLFGKHIDEDVAGALKEDDFDMLICERCVKLPKLRRIVERYAGVEGSGVMVVSKEGEVLGRAYLPSDDEEEKEGEAAGDGGAGSVAVAGDDEMVSREGEGKRKAEDGPEESHSAKRSRTDDVASSLPPSASNSSAATFSCVTPLQSLSSVTSLAPSAPPSSSPFKTCQAPPVLPQGDSPLVKLERTEGARANVYLEEGWMMRWCRCSQCLPLFIDFPYLLDEEDVYEPPEDPDAHKSTFELGMQHLMTTMPRAQALDSVRAFSGLSDRLKDFLRPHAERGVSISKDMIDSFFEQENERRQAAQQG